MGTEYYVVDKKNKRSFDLGKNWYERIVPGGPQEKPIEPVSVEELFKRTRATWKNDEDLGFTDEWCWMISRKLWAFCQVAEWNVEFRWDTTDWDDEYEHEPGNWYGPSTYTCVYSRYNEINANLKPDPLAEQQKEWEERAAREGPQGSV